MRAVANYVNRVLRLTTTYGYIIQTHSISLRLTCPFSIFVHQGLWQLWLEIGFQQRLDDLDQGLEVAVEEHGDGQCTHHVDGQRDELPNERHAE